MKKGICILAAFLISGAASLYGKKIRQVIFEKPENKTVSFSVFAGTDYSAPLYRKQKAKVILTICRFRDGKKEIIWQEVIDKGNVNNYPYSSKVLYRKVSVNNILDSKEIVAAYYKVLYSCKGSNISYENGVSLSPGSNSDSLQISI